MSPEIWEIGRSVVSALLFIFVLIVIAIGGLGSIYLISKQNTKGKQGE